MGGFFTGRTLTGIGRDLRAGRESARGLVARVLESVDKDLNAFVTLDAEGAETAARWADEELASGVDRGPLHGVPVAVKDIVDVAGLPTGMGSGHFAGYVAEADAACVTMLRDAGAVIVGKTGTQEFAFGGSGDVSVNGAVRNPRDRERMSGGSSSGSAVAVAAGMVPLAIGTDTGGSVRIPSAFCGIAGFKPPHGVIPTDGVFPLSRSLDHVGVLAATAEDCRLAYHALTGPAEAVPSLLDGSSGGGDRAGATPYGRVAWIEPPACDPEVERRVRALFPDAPSERIDFAGLRQVFLAIEYSEAYDVHAERVAEAPGRYQPATLARLEGAGRMPGWRLVRRCASGTGTPRRSPGCWTATTCWPCPPCRSPRPGSARPRSGSARSPRSWSASPRRGTCWDCPPCPFPPEPSRRTAAAASCRSGRNSSPAAARRASCSPPPSISPADRSPPG